MYKKKARHLYNTYKHKKNIHRVTYSTPDKVRHISNHSIKKAEAWR